MQSGTCWHSLIWVLTSEQPAVAGEMGLDGPHWDLVPTSGSVDCGWKVGVILHLHGSSLDSPVDPGKTEQKIP